MRGSGRKVFGNRVPRGRDLAMRTGSATPFLMPRLLPEGVRLLLLDTESLQCSIISYMMAHMNEQVGPKRNIKRKT